MSSVNSPDELDTTTVEQRYILVVDDDETIAMIIEAFLSEEGYAVVVAHNGKEALEHAKHTLPYVILLDMKMPVMDGWAFATAYREQPGLHAPIVVMTAAHDSHQRANEIAADGVLAKPFDLDDLLALVCRYVSRQGGDEQAHRK